MRQSKAITASALAITFSLLLAPAYALEDKSDKKDKEGTEPPWSQAAAYWGLEEMEAARKPMQKGNGHTKIGYVLADRFEMRFGDAENSFVWDGQGWYGGDLNKLWIKTEGEYSFESDKVEDAEVQALWSRAIAPYFDFQAGIRQDFEPNGLTHGVVAIQGLAPYWFEVDASAFLSSDGDLTARFAAEYDFLLTQRLILQPRTEINIAASDIPALEKASGITNVDAGLRLRYEFSREFAPYIGVAWTGSVGDTADIVRANGGNTEQSSIVLGLRMWY